MKVKTTIAAVLSQWRFTLIALASGVLMSLAPAPLGFWWIAWVALVPFWVSVVRSEKPITLGLVWGLAYHGITLHWITGLHPLMWMGIPWVASVSIVGFAWAFITLWGTACVCAWAWVMARLKASSGVRVLVGTALWCGLETVRQWTPLDWTSLSFTQSPHNLVILHLGQLSGAMTVTAAIVAINGLIAEAILAKNGKFWKSAIALFLMLHAIGFALYQLPTEQSNSLKVGIVQGNVPTRIKLFEDGLRQAYQSYSSGYRDLVDQDVDVVITPEGALPILWRGLNRYDNPVYQAVLEKQVPIFLGTFVPKDEDYTQSLLAIDSLGQEVGRYNKIKLVPLGEYIPFSEIIGDLVGRLSPIRSSLLPGDLNQQFDTPLGRVAVGICFDSVFGKVFREQVKRGAEFIVTASNLDPYSTVLMEQHQAQDVMRAIETKRWAARVTNTGYSGIVDDHGRVLWRSQPNQFQIYAGDVARSTTQTFYVRFGDWLTPVLVGVAVLISLRFWFSLS